MRWAVRSGLPTKLCLAARRICGLMACRALLAVLVSGAVVKTAVAVVDGAVTRLAGSGVMSTVNGIGTVATFHSPVYIAVNAVASFALVVRCCGCVLTRRALPLTRVSPASRATRVASSSGKS